MGSIVVAFCQCGYKSKDIMVGGGLLNFEQFCGFPYICKTCHEVITMNIFLTKQCPKCQSDDIYSYNFRDMSDGTNEKISVCWNEVDENGQRLNLTLSNYICPRCNEFAMKFRQIALFD